MDKIPLELLENAQKIQKTMDTLNASIGGITVTGSAGGGMVEIDMNGKQEMIAIRIEPDVTNDVDMLQDLILAAYNSAIEKVKDAVNNEIGSISNVLTKMIPDGVKF
jgi:DNA-binding YbaB/EbfC family protein